VLGVFIDPNYDFPVDVSIEIENIGGPSAGTMFALGIIDKLTSEDEANGEVIAARARMSPEARWARSAASSRSSTVRSGTAPRGSRPGGQLRPGGRHVPDGLTWSRWRRRGGRATPSSRSGAATGADLPTCS